jgi:hypothetical protein
MMKIKKNGKTFNLTESDIKKITVSLIKEQTTHSSETWDNQKKAKDNNKYCEKYGAAHVGPKFYEGQYCQVSTKWFDWESTPSVIKTKQGSGGRWKCGVGCVINLKEK